MVYVVRQRGQWKPLWEGADYKTLRERILHQQILDFHARVGAVQESVDGVVERAAAHKTEGRRRGGGRRGLLQGTGSFA